MKGGASYPFLFFGVRPGDWFDDASHAYELHFVQSLDDDRRLTVARAARGALTGAAWAGPWRWQGRFVLVSLRPLAASPESVRALHAAAVAVARAVHAVAPLVSVTYLHAADAGTDPWDDDTLSRALAPVAGPRWSTVSAGLVAEPARLADESAVDPAVEALLHGAVWAVERTERPAPAAEPVATPPPPVSPTPRVEASAPRAEAVPPAAGQDTETPTTAAPSSEAPVEGPAELVSVSKQTEDAPLDWAAVPRLPLASTTWPSFSLLAQYPKAREVTAPRPGRELAVVEDRKGAYIVLWVEGTTWKHGPLDQGSDTSHPSLHPTRDAVLYVDDMAEAVMLWEPPSAPRPLPIPSKGESFSDCAWLDEKHFVLLGQDCDGPMVFALDGDAVTLCGRAVLSGYMMAAVPGGFFAWDMDDVGKVTAAMLAWDGAALRIVGAVEGLSILRVASDGGRLYLDAGRGKRGGVFAVDELATRVQEALRGDPVRYPVRPLLAARLAAAAPGSEDEDNQVDEESDGSDDEEAEPQPDTVEDAEEAFSIGQDKRSDGEVDAAIVWMEHAVALRPTYAEAWAELGLARREGGDAAGAHEAWAEALRLHEQAAQGPDGYEARFAAAAVLARLGRREEMLAALAAVAQADPDMASWARDDDAFEAWWDDADFTVLVTPPPKKKKAKKG